MATMKSLRSGLLAAGLGLLGACAAPKRVEGPPANLRVLVLGLEDPEGHSFGERVLRGFSGKLVQALGRTDGGLEAAVAVRIPNSSVPLELDCENADIVIRPICPIRPEIEVRETRWGWALSLPLWMGTWILGLVIEDCQLSFGDRFRLEFEIAPGGEPRAPFYKHSVVPEPIPLTFWERNDFWSWPTVLTLFCPPVILPSKDVRGDELVASVARQLTVFLKNDFERAAFEQGAGSMELECRSCDHDAGNFELAGTIRSRRAPIAEVFATIGGRIVALDPIAVPGEHDAVAISATLPFPPELPEGEALDIVVRASSDQAFSRTLRVVR
ncbi:MAG: hypothetical protein KDE27_10020 [Planctomycetes bacterium]|nr:hypothetical protein [Planctomycetota bacterium]